MSFIKLSRLRRNGAIRDLFSQNRVLAKDLIMPYFVIEGRQAREPVDLMPGVYRLSVDNLLKDVSGLERLGIRGILLFGVSKEKNNQASQAYAQDGVIQKALRAIKKEINSLVVITDVCLCGYTAHGHCGIIKESPRSAVSCPRNKHGLWTMDYGLIDGNATLKVLGKVALSHARSGADFVAPSAMADGQVKAIRESLDKAGMEKTGILSYSVKYASNFYGPFREALDSRPKFGDRKTYQMDYRNSDEAMREIEQDIKEGSDAVMVKPALAYLDIINRVKEKFHLPLAAYNVSGEYSLIKTGAKAGLFDERQAVLETLTAMKRAGADIIITYYAKEVAAWLKET